MRPVINARRGLYFQMVRRAASHARVRVKYVVTIRITNALIRAMRRITPHARPSVAPSVRRAISAVVVKVVTNERGEVKLRRFAIFVRTRRAFLWEENVSVSKIVLAGIPCRENLGAVLYRCVNLEVVGGWSLSRDNGPSRATFKLCCFLCLAASGGTVTNLLVGVDRAVIFAIMSVGSPINSSPCVIILFLGGYLRGIIL